MKENKEHDKNKDLRNSDQDQLRSNTTNEVIREASGDPDMNLSDTQRTGTERDMDQGGGNTSGGTNYNDRSAARGMSYTPNDASAVRSGGKSDMDDQTSGGAGLTGIRKGAGANLAPKTGRTGSDFDGQNATS